ncbi:MULTISPECIES: ferritin-like domain-containing protein [Streptomonospora]|uniref:Ferritin-like domain-containing protein n=2 Tax=Streptomonospora TaxID=104204 RepID=A0ABV9SMV8_9ACTN
MGNDYGAVSRRTVVAGALAGIAAAALSGCQGPRWYPSEISPDEYVLRAVITEKRRLIARYEAGVSAGDGPVDLLERVLGHHRDHLAALRERLPERPGREPEAPETEKSPGPGPAPVGDEPVPVSGLRVAEQSAAASRARQLARLSDSGLAQLVASIGACETGHARLLSEA